VAGDIQAEYVEHVNNLVEYWFFFWTRLNVI
jgi:hypothetical protein